MAATPDSEVDLETSAETSAEASEIVPMGGADSAVSDDATSQPYQQEMPFAIVEGAAITELPRDLYIPPQALEVFLEAFEGPLDLLLYLIKKQNLDVLNIPIAEITRQYMVYVDLMKDLRLELAAEYLVMAAMLAEIKSRMLLPRPAVEEGEEGDPRAELVRRLQEYERYKQAAQNIDEMPQLGRDALEVSAPAPFVEIRRLAPSVSMDDLLHALKDVFARASLFAHHQVKSEALSVRERMSDILTRLKADSFVDFCELFTVEEGRRGAVVTLLALLELVKETLVELVQAKEFGPIHVRTVTHDA
ncbi:MAG: segregation and condensation protein A [Gammaproteobacteria bacterium]|jgi:segregation and condensation protein A